EASDEQTAFPVLYAVGRDGVAKLALEDEGQDLGPLFDTIVDKVPPPLVDSEGPLQLLVHNIEHDEYVGRLAIGRVARGKITTGERVAWISEAGTSVQRINAVYGYEAISRVKRESSVAGDIVAVAGLEDVQ